MASFDRPRHGWEGIYESGENYNIPTPQYKEKTLEEQLEEEGRESDRIADDIIRMLDEGDLFSVDEQDEKSEEKAEEKAEVKPESREDTIARLKAIRMQFKEIEKMIRNTSRGSTPPRSR